MSELEPSVRIGSRAGRNSNLGDHDSDEFNGLQRRLLHAQNNISFLQDQHKATLNELHREIDRLKLQNKDQQWRLVLNGAASPSEVLQETDSMRLKILEEENKDLRSKVESLLHSNERLKTELVNRAKTEKHSEIKKYHDTKYKSKYSKSSTPNKILPLIPGCKINGHEVKVEFPSGPSRKNPLSLPALRGVNQTIKHNRRLDAINNRFNYY